MQANPVQLDTMAQVIRHHGKERPNASAMRFEGSHHTYGEWDEQSSQIAQALLAEGVVATERVGFLAHNTPEYFPLLFGAAKINAVTLAVNWRLAPAEMQYILDHAEVGVLVIGPEFLDYLHQMELPHLRKVVVVGTPTGGYDSFDGWMRAQAATDPGIESSLDDVCYQLYTSGTTGLPKGVDVSNRALVQQMVNRCEVWQFDQDTVNLVCLPLFHIAGSGWAVAGLWCGADSVLLRDINPSEMLQVIPDEGVTNAIMVPAVIQMLLAAPEAATADFSSFRNIVYGAAPITEDVLVRAINTFGCHFVAGYGLTEHATATYLPWEDHDPGGPRAHLLRSVGKAVPEVEMKIVDTETMQEVADGEVGEVWVRGPQVMTGYARQPADTAAAMPGDGWLRTGDAGYMEEGYLYLKDRVKDMIISGGENVYPAEVENALMPHPEILDVAVIGIPDEKWGETVRAIVVAQPGTTPDPAQIIAFCRERLAHFKCPTGVDFLDVLPRNPSGKILKTDLREPYWQGIDRRIN
ncbi:MAG: long-chain acyl-CoA synthetase [Acidimicrobiales bacterium]|jgi:long-chain acyl-CoA synthetase